MTITPNKKTYIHVCYDRKGKAHRGEVMKKNPYEPILEFLEDAIADEAEGVAGYEQFRLAAERAGLITLADQIQIIMEDEQKHLAILLRFRKHLSGK